MGKRTTLSGCALAVAFTVAAIGLRMLLEALIGTHSPFLIAFLPPIFAAWYGGLLPGLVATGLSALATGFIFAEPRPTFDIGVPGWTQVVVFALGGAMVAVMSEARDRAREQLGAANRKAAEIVESITDAFVGFDAEFRYTYVNTAAERLLGKPQKELLGRRFAEVFPEAAGQTFEKQVRKAIAGQLTIHYEEYFKPWQKWYDTRLYPTADGGLSVYFREITAHKQEEQKALQLAALVESSQDAIISKSLEGIILTWNEGARRIYGYTAEEMIGRPVSVLLQPGQADDTPAILDRIRRGEKVVHMETTRRRKDGTLIPVALTVSSIVDKHGRVLGASTIARDMTERRRFEEKLRETQKLESLGVLAGGIAHDFNNLLTGILGNASLAVDMVPPGPVRAALGNIMRASERAADLTRQMLAYSGKGRFYVRPIDLSALVEDIAELIRSSIAKNVRLDISLVRELPDVAADPSQVQQLIMNLVINGGEAIGANAGVVTVSTTAVTLTGEEIRARFPHHEIAPGQYVTLEVRDTGIGMDEETRGRIFEPFFSTKFTGRGLGLAAVSGIVRGHHGAIEVWSAPGQGSVFRVFLPALMEHAPEAEAPAPTDRRGGAVLVVEDEEIVSATARVALEGYGYHVIVAEDGPRAVEILQRRSDEIALVLLDMTMPVMSGEETLDALRSIRSDLRVVVTSGYDETEAIRRFRGRSIAGFLQKPYTSAQLAAKVGAALR